MRGIKLSSLEYRDLMERSKMALSVRGGGYDTMRYWEIPASKTLLLAEQPDIDIPNNFVDGEHAIFFKPDLSDLATLVRTYAKDEALCRQMAERGYEHLLRYHTCERRAEYFLDICRRMV
jgi:spore maturation protein CgeB